MVKAKVFTYNKEFDGLPKDENFKFIEEELPPLEEGEILVEAEYLSVDPYMRKQQFLKALKLGSTFFGTQVAKIIFSKNPKFPVGEYVSGLLGWRTHTVINPELQTSNINIPVPVSLLPPLDDLPRSLFLGVFGMPGFYKKQLFHGHTAYFGFLEICQPKAGETVVVSGAAGAVGSHVGQIAKIKGCKVIGVAGSDEKGKWLVEDLKFDHFINYKTQNVEEELRKAAPNGVDCYFDNVGGDISSVVLSQMNEFGRTSVCGSISSYNDNEIPKATMIQRLMVRTELRMEGFSVLRWIPRWHESLKQNLKWCQEGKLKYQETITNGFENMPKAFREMLQGGNIGKAIVKV